MVSGVRDVELLHLCRFMAVDDDFLGSAFCWFTSISQSVSPKPESSFLLDHHPLLQPVRHQRGGTYILIFLSLTRRWKQFDCTTTVANGIVHTPLYLNFLTHQLPIVPAIVSGNATTEVAGL